MGRKFVKSANKPVDLRSGVTNASFQSFGKCPDVSEELIMRGLLGEVCPDVKPQATLAQDLTGRISWPTFESNLVPNALAERLESAKFFIRADLRVIRYYNTSTRISNSINVRTNGLNFTSKESANIIGKGCFVQVVRKRCGLPFR